MADISQISKSSSQCKDYEPHNILITGGLGFIGSHVVLQLCNLYSKYNIVILDKLDVCASIKHIETVKYQVTYINGDITNVKLVQNLFRDYKFDTIMHFAAQTHVDNSFGNSIDFTATNVLGTHVLLESAKKSYQAGILKRFIHVSTDEVYGETSSIMSENMILNPTNPYAASKAGAEMLVQSYHTSFGLPTIITRGNNVYGPHQYPEKMIPKFINLLLRDKPCCLHGDGSHCRSFLYVTDVARAFMTLLHKGRVGEIYNIGTDFEISNKQVALDLIENMDKSSDMIEYVADRAFNDQRYSIDGSKLQELGWFPMVEWSQGLHATIKWYKENPQYWSDVERVLVPHPGTD